MVDHMYNQQDLILQISDIYRKQGKNSKKRPGEQQRKGKFMNWRIRRNFTKEG